MWQDSIQPADGRWTELARRVEVAAQFHRYFPRSGFQGLSPAELQILLAVTAWPKLTASEIADALALERNSISKPLGKLEDAELVSSARSSSDGRSRVLEASQAAVELVNRYLNDVSDPPHAAEPDSE